MFYHPDTGRHMGIATVRFSTETQARRAMKEMDNRTLYGARVQIKWDPFGLLGHSAFEKALQDEKKAAQAKAKALQSSASGSSTVWTDRGDTDRSRGHSKEKEREQETDQQQQPEAEMYSPSQAGFDDDSAPAPAGPTPMSVSVPPPVAAPPALYPPIPPNALPPTPARPTAPPVVLPPPGQPPRLPPVLFGDPIPTLQVQRFAQTQAELERLFTAFQPSRICAGNSEGAEWFVEFPSLQHRDRAFTLLNAIVHAGRRLQLYVYDRNFRTEAPKVISS